MSSGALAGIVIVWLGLSFAVATGAKARGKSYGGFLLGSLFVSPLVAAFILLITTPSGSVVPISNANLSPENRCPYCGNMATPTGVICAHCQRVLPPLERRTYYQKVLNQRPELATIANEDELKTLSEQLRLDTAEQSLKQQAAAAAIREEENRARVIESKRQADLAAAAAQSRKMKQKKFLKVFAVVVALAIAQSTLIGIYDSNKVGNQRKLASPAIASYFQGFNQAGKIGLDAQGNYVLEHSPSGWISHQKKPIHVGYAKCSSAQGMQISATTVSVARPTLSSLELQDTKSQLDYLLKMGSFYNWYLQDTPPALLQNPPSDLQFWDLTVEFTEKPGIGVESRFAQFSGSPTSEMNGRTLYKLLIATSGKKAYAFPFLDFC